MRENSRSKQSGIKEYTSPRLTLLGDMTESTLGASGPQSDNAGFQSNGNGTQKSAVNRRGEGSTFDKSVFDKSVFDRK